MYLLYRKAGQILLWRPLLTYLDHLLHCIKVTLCEAFWNVFDDIILGRIEPSYLIDITEPTPPVYTFFFQPPPLDWMCFWSSKRGLDSPRYDSPWSQDWLAATPAIPAP